MICNTCCQTLYLVQNDTAPLLYAEMLDDCTGLPVDISDGSARLIVKHPDGTTSSLPGILLTGIDNGTIDVTPPYDEAGKGGRVAFALDTDTLAQTGTYTAEVEITYADGTVQTTYGTYTWIVRGQIG